jgi:predicted permease
LLSRPEIEDLRGLGVFEDVAAYTDLGLYNASGEGRPEELPSTITTHNLFSVLGVPLQLGGTWPRQADDSRGFNLVISHGLWQRRFGGDPAVVGRTMTLDGAPGYLILGVAAKGFAFPANADLYRSIGINARPESYHDRSIRGTWALGRLRRGVTVARARAEVEALGRRLENDFPATNTGLGLSAAPLRDLYVGHVRPYLVLLLGAVSLVLLVACANVMNLLLVRALAREREVTIRTALGASPRRIVRQLMTESVLLAVIAGVLGLLLAYGGVRVLSELVRLEFPTWMAVRVDGGVLAFTALLSLLTGTLAGLAPALRAARIDLTETLKEGGRGGASGGPRHRRLRGAFVVAEVALSVVLLVSAGLLLRSFRRLAHADPGFRPGGLLTFRAELGWRAYPTLEANAAFHRALLERLRALPGVREAATATNLPLSGMPPDTDAITIEGQGVDEQYRNPFVSVVGASPGYFGALGIPLRSGRAFEPTDTKDTLPVAILSESTAQRFFPEGDALGRRLKIGAPTRTSPAPAPWLTVVGVAGDVKRARLADAGSLDVYVPVEQYREGTVWAILRTDADPRLLARAAPEQVLAVDPNQSYFDVKAMPDRIGDRIWPQRLAGSLFGAFAALALLLAAIGLYGILAYGVAQRTREIGVRMALGADVTSVLGLVIGEGLRYTAAGLALGGAASLLVTRAVRGLVYEVGPYDPLAFGGAMVSLVAVGLLASALPARRAAAIQPMKALRD